MDRLICVAFPRTASTFLTESLKVAYPNIEVAHIFHKIDVLRKEKNIITILRKPEDAIASWMTKINDNDIEGNLDWYNRFMVATLNRLNDVFITNFESITTDVNSVIQKCRNYYSLQEPNNVNPDSILELLKENYPDRISKQRNLSLSDKIKESKNYMESFNLYNKIKTNLG